MTIKVQYTVKNTSWSIQQELLKLQQIPELSFDIETKGLYSKKERKEALALLNSNNIDLATHKLASVVSNNSGLSFPTLIETTHFIFGLDKATSIILIPDQASTEVLIWNWLKDYSGNLYIHNTLFDLKVMYSRIKALPKNYEDTALWVKTLINNSDSWKANVGLKELMGSYYDPAWTLIDEYEPENLLDSKFLNYAAIDGAATFYLYELIKEKL